MIMLNKEYLINHMRNENHTENTKNLVLGAACESANMFQCMLLMNQKLSDWDRFISLIQQDLEKEEYGKIHDVCKAIIAIKNYPEELRGLSMAKEDEELCDLYYQIFVGVLDILTRTEETMHK